MEFLSFYWPIILITVVNTFYHIASKGTSPAINVFASLTGTYAVALVMCIAMFIITGHDISILQEFSKATWATYVLAIGIVGLEAGFIYMYKSGWDISIGSLVCNIGLAVCLIIIGVLFYKEVLTLKKVAGILLCIAGLILINIRPKRKNQ